MVEPVVTSTICVCARPCVDKIVKEIASNEAVRDKTIANAPAVGARTRDLRMSAPSLLPIVRQRMDPKRECWTFLRGCFVRIAVAGSPSKGGMGGNKLPKRPIFGYQV